MARIGGQFMAFPYRLCYDARSKGLKWATKREGTKCWLSNWLRVETVAQWYSARPAHTEPWGPCPVPPQYFKGTWSSLSIVRDPIQLLTPVTTVHRWGIWQPAVSQLPEHPVSPSFALARSQTIHDLLVFLVLLRLQLLLAASPHHWRGSLYLNFLHCSYGDVTCHT